MADTVRILFLVVLHVCVALSEDEPSRYHYDSDVDTGKNSGYIDEMSLVPVRRNDFFLKASKSVPRIGRRNDFFYAKSHKSVPRIGRRNDFFLKASKSVPRIGRRDFSPVETEEEMISWPWSRDHEFIPRTVKKDNNKEIPESRHQQII